MLREKKRNWDKLQEQADMDKVQYRDVHEDQQLERSKIEGKQKPTTRIIFVTVVAVFAAIMIYSLISICQWGVSMMNLNFSNSSYSQSAGNVSGDASGSVGSGDSRYPYATFASPDGVSPVKWYAVDIDGNMIGPPYDHADEVPYPDWYKEYIGEDPSASANADVQAGGANGDVNAGGTASVRHKKTLGEAFMPDVWKCIATLGLSLMLWAILYQLMMRNLEAQNLMNDTADINQYQNDQHIALPEEVQAKFDWFPDLGAHSNVQVSSMISHVALSNKGLNKIRVGVFADKDIKDEDGDIEYYKGELMLDENGHPMTAVKPMLDTDLMEKLFDASGALKDKKVRRYFDATKIPYNKKNENRDKLKGFDTVADLINGDWTMPLYEPQRPAGAYIVDTAPVNTIQKHIA